VNGLIDENLTQMPYHQAQTHLGATRKIMGNYMSDLQHSLAAGSETLASATANSSPHKCLRPSNTSIGHHPAEPGQCCRARPTHAPHARRVLRHTATGLPSSVADPADLHSLQQALDMARRIGEGDLSASDLGPRDEFGQLLQALERSSANLRGILRRIGQASGQLSQASAALAGVIERTSSGAASQQSETPSRWRRP
jgi:hypothetical protein